MKKRTFHAKCPCCGERLVVDSRLRRVEALDPSKKEENRLLDEAGELLGQDEQKREDHFKDALESEKKKKPDLDDFL